MNCIQKDINILNYFLEFVMGNTNKIFIYCFHPSWDQRHLYVARSKREQFNLFICKDHMYLISKGDLLSFAYKYGIQKDRVKAYIYPFEFYEQGRERGKRKEMNK